MKKLIAVLAIFTSLFFAGCVTNGPTPAGQVAPAPVAPAPVTTATPTIPVTPETPVVPAVTESLKTYEGTGFTFTYPAKYTSDSVGLWTEEGYELHINPPEQCDTCQWPLVAVTSQETKGTLDKFVLEYYALMGTSLEQASEETGIPYSKVQLGDNEFIKVTVSDMVAITGYYAKKGDLVIGFEVSREEGDNDELKEIMSSLKFQ